MRNFYVYILFAISIGHYSCSERKGETPEKNFYFEIKTHQNNKFNINLADFLKKQIPQKKYTITNQSGSTWPYYKALKLDETVSVDSLMPPHWYLHKMLYKELDLELKTEDHFVQIDLMPQIDTILNYRVNVYKMDSAGLTLTATTGIHYIDSTKFSSQSALSEYYLQSIIRYSFK